MSLLKQTRRAGRWTPHELGASAAATQVDMSTASELQPALFGRKPPQPVVLRVWLLRDDPLRSAAFVLAAAAVAALAGWLSQSTAMGGLALAVCALAMWRVWIPVEFEIGPQGIFQTVLGRRRRIRWRQIQSHLVRSDGVLLLPEEGGSLLSAAGGLYLRWGDQRQQVLELIDYYVIKRANGAESSIVGGSSAGSRNSGITVERTAAAPRSSS